jgi:hypothetical protein
MQVKIIKDSIKKYKTLSEVQRELLRRGVTISLQALGKAEKGKTRTLRFDVLSALVDMAYNGDWSKAGKALKSDLESK